MDSPIPTNGKEQTGAKPMEPVAPVEKALPTPELLGGGNPPNPVPTPAQATVTASVTPAIPAASPAPAVIAFHPAAPAPTEKALPSQELISPATVAATPEKPAPATLPAFNEKPAAAAVSAAPAQAKALPSAELLAGAPAKPAAKVDAKAADTKKEKSKGKEKDKGKETEIKVKIKSQKKNRFLQSLNYMGLGKQRFLIIQNLSLMLKAGLPLVDSLKTLENESSSKGVRNLIQELVDSVENGTPFWKAMDNQGFFQAQAIALVRVGEEAGNLAENVARVAAQQEKDQALRSKIKMAMIYPSVVITIMVIMSLVLGIFVLPNIIVVLTSLNVPLPLATRVLITVTQYFSSHSVPIIAGATGGLTLLFILLKFTPLSLVSQWVAMHTPGIGELLYDSAIAQFGMTLGHLLQAGVPLVDAMHSLVDVTTTHAYKKFYQNLLDRLVLGDSFSKCFASMRKGSKLLPSSAQQLIMTGERTGSLSKIMLSIAEIYERKANDTAERLPIILEPIILVIIGAAVAALAFAIIIPIYNVVGNMSSSS